MPTESVATTGYHAEILSSSEGSTIATSSTTSAIGSTTQPTSQTPSPTESQPSTTISTTTPRQSYFSTSEQTTSMISTTTPYISQTTTTEEFCQHMEYIDKLIENNFVTTTLENIQNKNDFITNGVNFAQKNSTIVIDMPSGGAVVRDVKVKSNNVKEIMVKFTTLSGANVSSIQGNPIALPKDGFPKEKIVQFVIVFMTTTDSESPKNVTLSVEACAPTITSPITEGKILLPRYSTLGLG